MNIKNFDPYDFSKKEIDGVPVYYKNLPSAQCIHIRVVFKTGTLDDPVGKDGLSHFFEHLIFKGCPSLPTEKSITEWKRVNTLGTWNGTTRLDSTYYHLKCLPEKYVKILPGLRDMIFNSYLKDEDIESERKVILQESWNYFKNEKYLKYHKEFAENLFHGHIHEKTGTGIGWPDNIEKISKDDIISRYKDSYGIGNFFIVLTGAVEESHVSLLKDFLKGLRKVNKLARNSGLINKPKQKRFITTADQIGEIKETAMISLYRASEERSYLETQIRNVSRTLINDLMIERLRTENKLCYGVSANFWNVKEYSFTSLNVKAKESDIELIEKSIWDVLDEIYSKKYIERFEAVKSMYIERLRAMESLSYDIANTAIDDILRYEKVITQNEMIKEAEKVTYDDVIKFTKWAFDPEYVYTEIILPSRKQF